MIKCKICDVAIQENAREWWHIIEELPNNRVVLRKLGIDGRTNCMRPQP